MSVNSWEIHSLKLAQVEKSSSVVGSSSGSGVSYGGTGVSSSRGSTSTNHTTYFTIGNKTYELAQRNVSHPFNAGDELLVLCSRNKKSGIYQIYSFINNTNGIRALQDGKWELITGTIVVSFFALIALVIALANTSFIVFIIFLALLAFEYSLVKDWKAANSAVKNLATLDGITDIAEQERVLKEANIPYAIVGHE